MAKTTYKKTDDVLKKEEALNSLDKTKPAAWNGGDYSKALADSLNNIANREKFSYDVNKDMLFQQYKDLYQSQGKLAMENTMGQAAAMTGGYGNSYATTAGNQAYQAYMQNLMQIVPELRNAARDEYDAETNRLNALYSLYSDAYNRQYGEYNDKISQWWNEKNFAYGDYRDTLNFDYGKYSDDRNYNYQVSRDKVADDQWNQSFKYQQKRDKVADDQWQKQYNLSVANSNKSGGSSGGGYRNETGGDNVNKKNISNYESEFDKIYSDSVNKYGSQNGINNAKKQVDKLINRYADYGLINQAEYNYLKDKYIASEGY